MTLKTARLLAGLTQEELSLRSGIEESTISRLEKGRQQYLKTEYGTIARLACALGLDHGAPLFDVFPVPETGEKREAAAAGTATAR